MTALAWAWATWASATWTCFCAWATEADGAEDVGAAGGDGGLDADAGDGDVDGGLGVLSLGLGEVGFSLLDGDLVVAGIDLDDRLAGLDGLVLFDVDLEDLAADTGADLVEVAVYLGVVGVLSEGGAPVEEAGDER